MPCPEARRCAGECRHSSSGPDRISVLGPSIVMYCESSMNCASYDTADNGTLVDCDTTNNMSHTREFNTVSSFS
jgi:hypothetical protein